MDRAGPGEHPRGHEDGVVDRGVGRRASAALAVVGVLVPGALLLGLLLGPRVPGVVLGGGLLVLAVVRLLAPASAVGPLAVRSGPVDAVVAGTLGAALLVLSVTTPIA